MEEPENFALKLILSILFHKICEFYKTKQASEEFSGEDDAYKESVMCLFCLLNKC